jgi:predicted phage terminase large subunit-like protein
MVDMLTMPNWVDEANEDAVNSIFIDDNLPYLAQVQPYLDMLRDKQRPPDGNWLIWMIRAGRGFGKTFAGALWAIGQAQTCARIAIVAATFGDGRDFCVEGETGIKTLLPDLDWNRSIGEMTFPNGAKGKLFSAEKPDSLRGPNNYAAWCDEFGKWKYQRETWQQLLFTLRKGESKIAITTTPTPTKLIQEIENQPQTIVVRGSSKENLDNLSPAYIANVIEPFEGTRLGRQEIEGEILEDVEGALWQRSQIDALRVSQAPTFTRIVVAVDPAATSSEDANETGIIAASLGSDKHGYILDDATVRATPAHWAAQAIATFRKHGADRLVYETNQGGEMVLHTLKTAVGGDHIAMRGVHASRGKIARAEPIAALYEQGKVHHMGMFPALEDQLCSWVPGDDSPDRLDALVWALTDLMLSGGQVRAASF